jgi:protein-L-isoaspartate(D-aspartate) O-methyltransferase
MRMQTEFARSQMITQQVRAWEVLDERVLDAMRSVARERFVPARFRNVAFADTNIPLAPGRHMLAPKLVGRMLQALSPHAGDRALSVGSDNGYLGACLAALGAEVEIIERDPALAAAARANLAAGDVARVAVRDGDAFSAAPGRDYQLVVLTGSLPRYDARFEQLLAVGGRLLVVTGEAPLQEARLVTRVAAGEWRSESLFETYIDALDNAPRPEAFEF